MTNKRLWVLGASDPEMSKIEETLRACGEAYMYASCGGVRVHPGNAYKAEAIRAPESYDGAHDCAVYLVECCGPVLGAQHDDHYAGPVYNIDHHKPGDPGYGCPPSEFLSASSLGQVIGYLGELKYKGALKDGALDWPLVNAGDHEGDIGADLPDGRSHPCPPDGWMPGVVAIDPILGWCVGIYSGGHECGGCWVYVVIPEDYILTAAADHCLAAAYRGECPGVDPDELMQWRAENRAAFQGRTPEEVLTDVRAAQQELLQAPQLDLGTQQTLADMRRDDPVPELPEAATQLGVGYMAGPLIGPDGRKKYVCSGSPDQVNAWKRWALKNGFVDIYGDPARGFAGGYAAS